MFRRRPTCLLRNTVFPETREELCLVMKEQGLGQIIFQFSVVIFVCSMFRSRFMMFNTSIKSTADRNYTFATNSNFLISISFQPDGINICNFKTCLQYWFANWKRDLCLWQKLNYFIDDVGNRVTATKSFEDFMSYYFTLGIIVPLQTVNCKFLPKCCTIYTI